MFWVGVFLMILGLGLMIIAGQCVQDKAGKRFVWPSRWKALGAITAFIVGCATAIAGGILLDVSTATTTIAQSEGFIWTWPSAMYLGISAVFLLVALGAWLSEKSKRD